MPANARLTAARLKLATENPTKTLCALAVLDRSSQRPATEEGFGGSQEPCSRSSAEACAWRSSLLPFAATTKPMPAPIATAPRMPPTTTGAKLRPTGIGFSAAGTLELEVASGALAGTTDGAL